MAWRRELRLPLANLRMVHVEESPLAGLHMWRRPGLCWPGAFAVGTAGRPDDGSPRPHTPATRRW